MRVIRETEDVIGDDIDAGGLNPFDDVVDIHDLKTAFGYFAADDLIGRFNTDRQPVDAGLLEQVEIPISHRINACVDQVRNGMPRSMMPVKSGS